MLQEYRAELAPFAREPVVPRPRVTPNRNNLSGAIGKMDGLHEGPKNAFILN